MLKEIHADQIQRMDLYHKCDLTIDDGEEHEHSSSIYIKESIDKLMNDIVCTLYPFETKCELSVPYSNLNQLQPFYEVCSISEIERNETGVVIEAEGERHIIERLTKLFE